MIKKIHLSKIGKNSNNCHISGFLTILFFISSLYICAQTDANDDTLSRHISAKTVEGNNDKINDVLLTWDFSGIQNKENTSFTIEVQPLGSCWDGLNGKLRSEKKSYKIENTSQGLKSQLRLTSFELNSKCLKWRVKAVNTQTGKETYSDWQFSGFM